MANAEGTFTSLFRATNPSSFPQNTKKKKSKNMSASVREIDINRAGERESPVPIHLSGLMSGEERNILPKHRTMQEHMK